MAMIRSALLRGAPSERVPSTSTVTAITAIAAHGSQ